MRTETRDVHWCDHCKKRYLSPTACLAHERKCSLNPDNARACYGCIHLDTRQKEVPIQYDFSVDLEKRKVLYCTKHDKYVYPPNVEHSKKGAYDLGEVKNEPMPRECEERTEQ